MKLESVRAYLDEPRCAVLSTLNPDGRPHQVVVHYRVEDDALLVNGRPDRLWAKNLRRDGRVSFLIPDAANTLHWVGVTGVAEVVREGEPAIRDAMGIAERYGEDPNDYLGHDRVSFRFRPERVLEYG